MRATAVTLAKSSGSIADNHDGTVSLLATLFEAESPNSVEYSDKSAAGLASLYRELSFNDIHRDPKLTGTGVDQNVELLVHTGR